MWLNVLDEFGNSVDWSILQFKIDKDTNIKGWQYWNSDEEVADWVDIAADLPVTAGVYKLAIYYSEGNFVGYINGIEVFSYAKGESEISSVKEVIFNSYSFGESYEVNWKIPTVSYVEKYPVGSKFISTEEQLSDAIANQADGQTWIIEAGTYDVPKNTTVNRNDNGAVVASGGQSGWFIPITANNLTIAGDGEVLLTTTDTTGNGPWASQSMVMMFGNNLRLKDLKITSNAALNKVIEVMGIGLILDGVTLQPLEDEDYAGAIYLNPRNSSAGPTKEMGTITLKNVTIKNGDISYRDNAWGTGVMTGVFDIDNLSIENDAEDIYPLNHGLLTHPGDSNYGTAANFTFNITNGFDIEVGSLSDLKEFIDMVPSGATVTLSPITYYVSAALTPSAGVTVNNNGATIVVLNAATKLIKTIDDLTAAIAAQADNQTWYIKEGTYNIPKNTTVNRDNNGAVVASGGQNGWFMPITANGLTIIGDGDVLLTTTDTTGNGAWASQDMIAMFGQNLTLKNLVITSNAALNKVIEVMNTGLTLEDVTLQPLSGANYAGAIYLNPRNSSGQTQPMGTVTLKNVTIKNGDISYRDNAWGTGAMTGVFSIDNLSIENDDEDIYPLNHGLLTHPGDSNYGTAANFTFNSTNGFDIAVGSLSNLQEFIDMVPSGATVTLSPVIYYVSAALTHPAGVIVDENDAAFVIVQERVDAAYTGLDGAAVGGCKRYKTIQAAIGAANAGDTITVATGTYDMGTVILTKPVSIIGAGDDTVINGKFLLSSTTLIPGKTLFKDLKFVNSNDALRFGVTADDKFDEIEADNVTFGPNYDHTARCFSTGPESATLQINKITLKNSTINSTLGVYLCADIGTIEITNNEFYVTGYITLVPTKR